MRSEATEEMLTFTTEVCRKYDQVKTIAEGAEASWKQNLEMAATSKYPGEKEMYDQQAADDLARYTAAREWLKLVDGAVFQMKNSNAQAVIRQHCLNRIPLKAVEFDNGKRMGKTAVFYHKKNGLKLLSEELSGVTIRLQELEKKFCKI